LLWCQVLAKYVEYADAVVGRFGVKPDGSRTPNVRTVARPLLNLFVGEPSGRKWRHLMDVALLKKPATVAEVVQVGISPSQTTAFHLPACVRAPALRGHSRSLSRQDDCRLRVIARG
jgi:hypothetical protein